MLLDNSDTQEDLKAGLDELGPEPGENEAVFFRDEGGASSPLPVWTSRR